MDEIETLKSENEKLKETESLNQDLISVIAHQLRTSISAIKWVLELVLDKSTGPLTPEQESLLRKADTSNQRIIALVNDLLNFNHAEDILNGYTFEKIQITDLIENVIFEFASETKKNDIEIIFLKPEKSLPEVWVDQSKLRVVFENLIENAIKYGNRGDKIFLSLASSEKAIKISIKDNGVGIPEDAQAKVFEKFYRAPNAIAHAEVGTGLGLFTSKRIVERHGGMIGFIPNAEHGTTFFFTIPFGEHEQTI